MTTTRTLATQIIAICDEHKIEHAVSATRGAIGILLGCRSLKFPITEHERKIADLVTSEYGEIAHAGQTAHLVAEVAKLSNESLY